MKDRFRTVDNGHREIHYAEEKTESFALDAIDDVIAGSQDGWRLHKASINCPLDRGRRLAIRVEMVSPSWVARKRKKRLNRQKRD